MFQNFVSLIERVDDAAGDIAAHQRDPSGESQAAGGQPVVDATLWSASQKGNHWSQASSLHSGKLDDLHGALASVNPIVTEGSSPRIPPQNGSAPFLDGHERPSLEETIPVPSDPSSPPAALPPAPQSPPAADVGRVAQMESTVQLQAIQVDSLAKELERVCAINSERHMLLGRLCALIRAKIVQPPNLDGGGGVLLSSDSQEELEQLCCEVDVVVGVCNSNQAVRCSRSSVKGYVARGDDPNASTSSVPLDSLQRLHQSQVDALSKTNARLQQRLLDEETLFAQEKVAWAAECGQLSAQAERSAMLLKEVERRKEEALHAWSKMSSMQTAIRQSTEQCAALQQQVDALQRVVLIRDEELAISQAQLEKVRLGLGPSVGGSNGGAHSSSGSHTVVNSKVLRAVADSNRYCGPLVVKTLSLIDAATFSFVRLLVRQAWLRIFIAIYFTMMHVHMFHVVSLIVHAGLPHEVGDDVNDHIKHHLVK